MAWMTSVLAAPVIAMSISWAVPILVDRPSILRIAQADAVDGFVASCTGNLDGTGQCINQETGQRFTCTIIPGQVIDCKSPKAMSFQCVWVSGVQANYADFWCDQQVDALLRNEISSQRLRPSLSSPLGPGPSGAAFPGNEITPDRYSRDRFKSDETKLDDPFGQSITAPGASPELVSPDFLTPSPDSAPTSTPQITPLLPSRP